MRRTLLLTAVAAMTCGCNSVLFPPDQDPKGHTMRGVGVPHARTPQYDWGFENRSGHAVHGVGMIADTGEVAAAGATLAPEPVGAKQAPGLDPIPRTARLSWTTPAGDWHEEVFEIASAIDDIEHFSGTIYFVYGVDDKWTVTPISREEASRRMKAHQPVVP